MSACFAAGVTVSEFWDLTHRETYAVLSGDAIRRRKDLQTAMWAAWHSAAFERAKRLPNLRTILQKMEPRRVMSDRELRTTILGIAKAMNAEVVYRKAGEA